MKSRNKPKREKRKSAVAGREFAEKKQRNKAKRWATIRWLLTRGTNHENGHRNEN